MKHETNHIVWNIQKPQEIPAISKRLGEYAIPFEIGNGELPNHKGVLVSQVHFIRASTVLARDFGRRLG